MKRSSESNRSDHLGQPDPVWLRTRREAAIVLCTWLLCMTWTMLYCWRYGYADVARETDIVFGMPRWVFAGVFVPWVIAGVFSVVFGLFGIGDDPLGDDVDE